MNKNWYITYLIIVTVLIVTGCNNYYTKVSNNNVSYLYNPSTTSLKPDYKLFHNKEETSVLFFRIRNSELLFNKTVQDINPHAGLKIHYELLRSYESNEIVDSATVSYKIEKSDTEYFSGSIDLKIPSGERFVIKLVMEDMIRGRQSILYLEAEKLNTESRQNFLILDHANNVKFTNHVRSNEALFIDKKRNTPKKIYVSYFNRDFRPSQPPFSMTSYKSNQLIPDSVKVYEVGDSIKFNGYGMYFIQNDTALDNGVTLFNWGDSYPKLETPTQLLKPIRYLVSNKEFKKYNEYANIKLAVDDFWLKTTGNIERAKELIRVYYNRALHANKYFNSYLEGWKSDRGMIYMIYGAPKRIYKTNEYEKWIYGDNPDLLSITFTFNKLENTYSDNDYILIRKEVYKSSWYQAVDTWRNGRVYSIVH